MRWWGCSGYGHSLSLALLTASSLQAHAFTTSARLGLSAFPPICRSYRLGRRLWQVRWAYRHKVRWAMTPNGEGEDEDSMKRSRNDFLHAVEEEKRRVLAMPTIDIKLELQMRGVEHRDTFEKSDLINRLAEARAKAARGSVSGPADASQDQKEGSERRWLDDNTKDRFARDVARAKALGTEAAIRELNAMGVPHSRLSDLSVLANQYAIGRREARKDDEENRRFRVSEKLQQQGEVAKAKALGRTELIARLRDLGVRFSLLSSDEQLARLFVEVQDTKRATQRDKGKVLDPKGGFTDGNGGLEGEERSQKGRRWERWIPSRQTWEFNERDNDENVGEGTDGSEWEEKWRRNGYQWERGEMTEDSDIQTRELSGSQPTQRPHDPKRALPLRVQASRMTSRELMSELDSMKVLYPIPSSRSELQHLFIMSKNNNSTNGGGDDMGRSGAVVSEEDYGRAEESLSEYDSLSFRTFESALRWARQLTYGDVINELECRGVAFKPNADYSFLTRLLADSVIVDESMNPEYQDLDNVEDYEAELDLAMTMSRQAISRELESLGVQINSAWSKIDLAKQLAEINLQREGGGWLPISNRDQSGASRRMGRVGAGQPNKGDVTGGRRLGSRPGGTSFNSEGKWWEGVGLDDEDEGDDIYGQELEALVHSLAGAMRVLTKEAASFAAGCLAFFFSEDGNSQWRGQNDGDVGTQTRFRSNNRRSSTSTSVAYGDDEDDSGQESEISGLFQSSANRAAVALVSGAANAGIRGAEAAAEWAGGDLLPREYVLVTVATFCLVFKRGVGSSLALLVVIRAARIALQQLVRGRRRQGREVESRRSAQRTGRNPRSNTTGARRRPGEGARGRGGRRGGKKPPMGTGKGKSVRQGRKRPKDDDL